MHVTINTGAPAKIFRGVPGSKAGKCSPWARSGSCTGRCAGQAYKLAAAVIQVFVEPLRISNLTGKDPLGKLFALSLPWTPGADAELEGAVRKTSRQTVAIGNDTVYTDSSETTVVGRAATDGPLEPDSARSAVACDKTLLQTVDPPLSDRQTICCRIDSAGKVIGGDGLTMTFG